MKMTASTRPITIFTPSFADENNTNAQNLTVKEIVARLPPELFRVVMLYSSKPDARITQRKNTRLLRSFSHGNALHWLASCCASSPDLYFFPRCGPLDRAWLTLRRKFGMSTALVTYVVIEMNDVTGKGLVARSILEADSVLANSTYVAETVQQRFGVRAGTIYNGIDRRFFFHKPHAASPARRPLTVLYAGSFQARKRVELVIEQAARRRDVMFRLAGQGETEATCRALATRLGCHNIVFLGHLTPAQLGEEMRRADIFLFPSILEGHPQVLGQASACGLPAIAMNVYRPDYVVHGKTGFLLEAETEIPDTLDLLLRDSALRQSMAAAAIQHSQQFDWDRIAEQWMAVFWAVASRC